MAAPKLFNLIILFLVVAVATMSTASATVITQFFYAETYVPPFQTAFNVTTLNNTSGFGTIRVNDNFLVDKQGVGATTIGRGQGFSVVSSLDGTTFTTTQTFIFTAGTYNGSTLTVVGRSSSAINSVSEIPVVGGTGQFRLASGYALNKVLFSNSNLTVVQVDLFVLP